MDPKTQTTSLRGLKLITKGPYCPGCNLTVGNQYLICAQCRFKCHVVCTVPPKMNDINQKVMCKTCHTSPNLLPLLLDALECASDSEDFLNSPRESFDSSSYNDNFSDSGTMPLIDSPREVVDFEKNNNSPNNSAAYCLPQKLGKLQKLQREMKAGHYTTKFEQISGRWYCQVDSVAESSKVIKNSKIQDQLKSLRARSAVNFYEMFLHYRLDENISAWWRTCEISTGKLMKVVPAMISPASGFIQLPFQNYIKPKHGHAKDYVYNVVLFKDLPLNAFDDMKAFLENTTLCSPYLIAETSQFSLNSGRTTTCTTPPGLRRTSPKNNEFENNSFISKKLKQEDFNQVNVNHPLHGKFSLDELQTSSKFY